MKISIVSFCSAIIYKKKNKYITNGEHLQIKKNNLYIVNTYSSFLIYSLYKSVTLCISFMKCIKTLWKNQQSLSVFFLHGI